MLRNFIAQLARQIRGAVNSFLPGAARRAGPDSTAPDIYGFEATTLQGRPFAFSSQRGKVLLIVNTASRCGFTYQYEGLQKIYVKYQDRGVELLGFPSNDFMGQEPGGSEEIASFCELNFGVTFPLFEKRSVCGKDKQPIFRFLTESGNPQLKGEIHWNFEKFLIDRSGKLVARFNSLTDPEKIEPEIERLLSE